jgi:serine/threonine protein kinase
MTGKKVTYLYYNFFRHMVRMLRSFTYSNHFCIVFEMLDLSLRQIYSKRKTPLKEIRIIARQLLEATSYLHSIGVIHTDLKPGKTLIL